MLTLTAIAILVFVVVPASAWVLGLMFRVLGWTMRMVFSVLLLPLWIVLFVLGGVAAAAQIVIPIALVILVLSMLAPQN